MTSKIFEVRDKGTRFTALAIQLESYSEDARYLLAQAGFGLTQEEQKEYVLFCKIDDDKITYDPYNWGVNRTREAAHKFLRDHFYDVEEGTIIDAEYLLNERRWPKVSDRAFNLVQDARLLEIETLPEKTLAMFLVEEFEGIGLCPEWHLDYSWKEALEEASDYGVLTFEDDGRERRFNVRLSEVGKMIWKAIEFARQFPNNYEGGK